MWIGSPRRGQVVRRNKSAPQALGRRLTGPPLILTTLVATLSMSLAIAASASASSSLAWRGNLTDPLLAPALSFTGPVAWGDNEYGQLGDGKSGSENNSDVPVALSGVSEVVALAGGFRHSLALLGNGTVLAWGYNGQGQLGNGSVTSSDVPVAVSGLTEVTAIAAGEDFSLALLKNGTVMSWGNNEVGRLGDGKEGSENNSVVPVKVSGLTEVAAISAGSAHSLALLKNGTVMSWGLNAQGQLGDGLSGFEHDSDVPVPVSSLSGVASVAAGGLHSLAVLSSGAVMAWGTNSSGELGTGSVTGPETCSFSQPCAKKPVAVSGLTEASAAAGGKTFSLALQKSGAVVAWGDNTTGELGDGVTEGPESCRGVFCSTKPVPVSGLTEAAAISAGDEFALARLKAGGVAAWGGDGHGQLGDGVIGPELCAGNVPCSRTPVRVDGLSATTMVSAGGGQALALGTLAPIPTITSVEPNDGPAAGGTAVTITGTNLGEVTAVKFGSTNATSFKVESETKISATSPPGAGVVDVTVTTANATSPITSADHFDYAPTVTQVEPNDGPAAGGTAVTITGTNFNEVSAVKFGSTNATNFKVESAGKIRAHAPAGTGSVDVTVTSAGGTSPTGASDLFDYAPTVNKIEPRQGSGGTSVTITGTNFNEVSAVKFGSNSAASVTVNSPTSITALSPAGSGTVDVTVTTAGGTSPTSEADRFTYGPEVTAVSPGHGSPGGGTSVTITGSRFSGATAVKFGSATATSFKVESATSITAVSPSGTGTVDVTVTTPEGTSATSAADRFDYGPTVTNLEPKNGPNAGGTSVQIVGTNFNEVEAVKFGSTNVSFTRNSETSITAVSPPWAGGSARVRVTVTTRGGVNPEPASSILGQEYFGYAPIVTSVSPSAGSPAGGTNVTIQGGAFESKRGPDEFPPFVKFVKFGSTNATSFEVHPAGEEASVTAVAPAGTGTVDVTVETYAGTSLTSSADLFSYALAPTVTNVEPHSGPAAGGTSVTITGTNFTRGSVVKFGSTTAASVTVNSETSITAVSPAGTGTVDVTVTTPVGISATSPTDQFNFGPAVTKIEPNQGPPAGGTAVAITGTNFAGATAVKFGTTNATSFTVNSETSITAVSPAGASTVDVTVTTPGGTSETSTPDKFSYLSPTFNAHYYSNNAKLKEAEGKFGEAGVKEVIGWGTIELKGEKGGDIGTFIRCHNIIGGVAWNPVGGGAGKGKTQASAVFDCETNLCAAGTVVNVGPENLPWSAELVGGGLAKTNEIRALNTGVKLDVTCNGLSTAHYQGSYQPGAQAGENKGTGMAHPGFVEFDQPGSGELEEAELGGSSAPRGVVHEFGYAEGEMIQAK